MENDKKIPRHVQENWVYGDGKLCGKEANEIIEEIMLILIKHRISIKGALEALEDTKEAIMKEAILGERNIDGKIIQVDR